MKLDFPQGSLDKVLSSDMQELLFEKLKPAVWLIGCQINGLDHTATAFCVDQHEGLLLTAAHTFEDLEKTSVKIEDLNIYARRDLDPDDDMIFANVVHVWRYFDLALIQVNHEHLTHLKFQSLDYVTFDDSPQLSVGMDLFSIGVPRSQGFQIIRGILGYELSNGFTDYSAVANDRKFLTDYQYMPNSAVIKSKGGTRRVPRNSEETNFYIDNLNGGMIENSFINDGEMHPKVKFLQMEFGSAQELSGMSGSPIFNSTGKVVAIFLSSRYGSIYGLPSSTFDAFLQSRKT